MSAVVYSTEPSLFISHSKLENISVLILELIKIVADGKQLALLVKLGIAFSHSTFIKPEILPNHFVPLLLILVFVIVFAPVEKNYGYYVKILL